MNTQEVMQQALYALEKAHHAMQADMAQEVIENAINSLRAALAEPQEPLGWAVQVGTHSAGRRQGKPRYALFFNKADAEHLADRTKEARPEPFYLEGA